MLLLIGLALFTPPGVFVSFVNKYHYFIEVYYYANATLKLNFEKLNPMII